MGICRLGPLCWSLAARQYLKAFKTDLFLSAHSADVKQAIDCDVAAGMILPGNPHADPRSKIEQIRIAFDGDAVLFAAEAERIYSRRIAHGR